MTFAAKSPSSAEFSGRKRILAVVGTRPEAIKLAPVLRRLPATACEVKLCVTAQHRELLDQTLRFFGLIPDFDLNLMRAGQSPTEVAAGVLSGVRDVLRQWTPDWVLVQGDTTTVPAAAWAAFHEKVPVSHIEAGLRTGNIHAPWPEEINRRLASVLAALHFAPTEGARRNLLRENISDERIFVVGNPVIDALLDTAARLRDEPETAASAAAAFPFLDDERKLILVTGHRRENFGRGLEDVCRALKLLAQREDVRLIYPVHPNPRVREPVERLLGGNERLHLVESQDYPAFVFLMTRAYLIITDSGGVQEEAPSLGKPVLVTRETTERPEAVEAGTVKLVGTDTEKIVAAATALLDDPRAREAVARVHNPYGDGRAGERIAKELLRAEAV